MTTHTTTEEAAKVFVTTVLDKITLQADGSIQKDDSQFVYMKEWGQLHLIAVLRKTGWIRDGTISTLLEERLRTIARESLQNLKFDKADHVACPAALAWLLQRQWTTDEDKERLREKLDDETFEVFLKRGDRMQEKFFREFIEVCAGF